MLGHHATDSIATDEKAIKPCICTPLGRYAEQIILHFLQYLHLRRVLWISLPSFAILLPAINYKWLMRADRPVKTRKRPYGRTDTRHACTVRSVSWFCHVDVDMSQTAAVQRDAFACRPSPKPITQNKYANARRRIDQTCDSITPSTTKADISCRPII